MIRGYADHAANERTFLAWVRTGIAVIAFGFVVSKFNIFVATVASAALGSSEQRQEFAHLSGPLGRYGGLALIVGGIVLIVLSTLRFVRTTRLLDDPGEHSAASVRAELILSAALVLLVACASLYLALGTDVATATKLSDAAVIGHLVSLDRATA